MYEMLFIEEFKPSLNVLLHNPHTPECNQFQTQLVNNNFDISIDELSLQNDAWCIETSIDNTVNL